MKSNYLFGKSRSGSNTLHVVKILQDYNKPIPQDFLASLVNWEKKDARVQLKSLEDAGLVKLIGTDVEIAKRDK